MATSNPDLFSVVLEIGRVLSDLGVPFHLGGSLASSIHGFPRATLDADLVADLRPGQGTELAARLAGSYYADQSAIEGAIRERESFNLIHLDTMFKVDVFLLKDDRFHRESFERSREEVVGDSGTVVRVSTPEDTVLHKLLWYRAGAEVSERQWTDLVGVLRVKAPDLDLVYLESWADRLGLASLLDRAQREAAADTD